MFGVPDVYKQETFYLFKVPPGPVFQFPNCISETTKAVSKITKMFICCVKRPSFYNALRKLVALETASANLQAENNVGQIAYSFPRNF
jgi:hypothetical protein